MFKDEYADHELSLAETFSAQIFQITGLMGFAFLTFILITGKNITFNQTSIIYYIPLLLVTVTVKYLVLLMRKFKSSKIALFVNIVNYIVF